MTVIAWDGTTLAADRRACVGSVYRTIHKLHRVGDRLCASAGNSDMALKFRSQSESRSSRASQSSISVMGSSIFGECESWPTLR